MTATTKNHKSGDSSNLMFVGIIALVLVLGAAGVAVMATGRDRALDVDATGSVEVDGEALPPMPKDVNVTNESNDPAFGQVAPTLVGTDFEGNELVIEPTGRPAVIYFLAHWCGFCQAEVPVVQELVDEGAVPENVDIYAVSTSYRPDTGGGHPKLWLEGEGFTVPTMRDDASNSALVGFGGGGFPYAIYLDSDHKVIARSTGSLSKSRIAGLWEDAGNA